MIIRKFASSFKMTYARPDFEQFMSKTRYTKQEYRKLMDEEYEGVFISNVNVPKLVEARLSRHPYGTRAKGLRKDKRGAKFSYYNLKERFREVEVQSSRLHAIKRGMTHSVRQMGKSELRKEMSEEMRERE